jgi:hypothetical protein
LDFSVWAIKYPTQATLPTDFSPLASLGLLDCRLDLSDWFSFLLSRESASVAAEDGHFEARLRLFKVAKRRHCYSKNGRRIRSALLKHLVAGSFSNSLERKSF